MPSESLIAMDSRCASQCEGSNPGARIDVRDSERPSEMMQKFLQEEPHKEPFNGLMPRQTQEESKSDGVEASKTKL